jgi:hypothetical protein
MISTPTFEAISLVEATMPWRALTGSREAANVETLEWLWKINGAVMAIARKAVMMDRKVLQVFWALINLKILTRGFQTLRLCRPMCGKAMPFRYASF